MEKEKNLPQISPPGLKTSLSDSMGLTVPFIVLTIFFFPFVFFGGFFVLFFFGKTVPFTSGRVFISCEALETGSAYIYTFLSVLLERRST